MELLDQRKVPSYRTRGDSSRVRAVSAGVTSRTGCTCFRGGNRSVADRWRLSFSIGLQETKKTLAVGKKMGGGGEGQK